MILESIRKPKKLVAYGSDEKTYSFLVKGIEDLRLDQRIEQLFSVFNSLFTKNNDCYNRELRLT